MKRRALITGAEGFVGRVLSGYLAGRGWEVVGCDRRVPPEAGDCMACDVCDAGQVRRLLEWAGEVTHVFHLAALTFVPDTDRDPASAFETNLVGTIRLLDGVWEQIPQARFLYVGSADAYGVPETLPIREDHPLKPQNPYAISKAAADQYCAFLGCATGADVVRLRPFNHSGPGQADHFVLSSFARQIARIEAGHDPAVLHTGNLDAARDFCHVRDVVRAYELAAMDGVAGEVYNVCSGRAVSIRAVLDQLLALSTAAVAIETDPERLRAVDVLERYGSHEKLTAHTGWRPEIPLDTLLKELLGFWRGRERG